MQRTRRDLIEHDVTPPARRRPKPKGRAAGLTPSELHAQHRSEPLSRPAPRADHPS